MGIEDKIRQLLKEHLGITEAIDNLNSNDDLISLGYNSLNFVKIIIDIEDEFRIEFDDSQLSYLNFPTIASIKALIEEKIMDISYRRKED